MIATEAGFRGWITQTVKIKSPKFEREQVEPFDEKQVPCILKGASELNGGVTGFATNGPTFRLLVELKYYASWTAGRKLNLERLLSETL